MSKRAEQIVPRDRVSEFVAEALAMDGVASMLQIDIDRFDEVNRTLGRETGDRVLATVLGVAKATAKEEGWTYMRLGGDEFALVAPAIALEPAFLRAESLRVTLGQALAGDVRRKDPG